MADVEIEIGVHDFKNGKKAIVWERKHANKNDDVFWVSKDDFPFSIDFGWDTPFKEEKIKAEKEAAPASVVKYKTQKHEVKDKALKKGEITVFKYSIAVYVPAVADPTQGQVLIEDPEIIIDP
jgi:hypothetical protein